MTGPAQVHVTRRRSRDRSTRGSTGLAAVVSVEPAPPPGNTPPGPGAALEVGDEGDET